MSDYVNPETISRYERGFNKYAKSGKLNVLDITKALEEAKEDFNQDDVFDALEVMGIKDEPISTDQFFDLKLPMLHQGSQFYYLILQRFQNRQHLFLLYHQGQYQQ